MGATVKVIIAMALVGLLAGPAAGQALEGRFSAAALGEVPAQASVRVELLDNTDLNLRLLEDFERKLTELGYQLSSNGAYELSFTTEEITDSVSYENSGIFRLEVDTGKGCAWCSTRDNQPAKQAGGTESRTKLWSSTQDSLFARRDSGAPGEPVLRMEIEIRDTTDKPKVVWVARAETLTRRADFYRLFQQMLPTILENIGSDVDEEIIVLR